MPSLEHPNLLVPLISGLVNSALGTLLCVITSGFSFVVPLGTHYLSSLFNSFYPVLHLLHHPSYLCQSNTFLSSAILKCLLELLIQSIWTYTYSSTASCLILQNSNSKLFYSADYQSRCSILAPLETWSAQFWGPTAASVDRKQNCVFECVCGAWRIASIIDNLRCKVNLGLVATAAASGQQHLRQWKWGIRHTHWWLSW